MTASGDFVWCPVTVKSAEESLIPGAQYFQFSLLVHRAEADSFASPLSDHVDFVAPTYRFQPQMWASTEGSSNTINVTEKLGTDPTSIRTLYNISGAPATGNPMNQQHHDVAGFLSKFMSPNDLDLLYGQYYPEGKNLPNGKPTVCCACVLYMWCVL